MKDMHKASQLMDAIGNLDDGLIWEAETYRPARRYTEARRWVTVAASLLITVAVILLATIGGNLIGGSKPSPDPEQGEQNKDPQFPDQDSGVGSVISPGNNGADSAKEIDKLLAEGSREERKVLLADIPYYDEFYYIVWARVGSDDYYISDPINLYVADDLVEAASSGTYANGATIDYYIWVICPDGAVFSPHLIPNSGNIYYGTLFDYEVELLPSDFFAGLLSTILIQ